MGYIELKTGQVALRPKKITPPPPPPITPDWTEVTLPKTARWTGIAYGAGKFVAVANSVNYVITSSDGITWNTVGLPFGASWTDVVYGNGKFVISSMDKYIAYSTDGITWSTTGSPSGEYPDQYPTISFAKDTFIGFLSMNSASVDYSTDGITWQGLQLTEDYTKKVWRKAVYGDGKYIIASNGNYAVRMTEIVAKSGTLFNIPLSNVSDITYGNGKFVAVGSNYGTSLVAYSTDSVTWATSPLDFEVNSITYGDNKFVIIGAKSAYSMDGVTWTDTVLPDTETWENVAYGNNKYVTIASGYDKNKAAYWNKQSTNGYILAWEGAEQTGTQWQYHELPAGGYYLSYLWRITPSVPFDTANTLILNTNVITNDTPLYTVVQPSDYLNLGDTAFSKIFATVTKVWRHVTTTPSSIGGAANVTTWEVWLFNDGNFGLFGYQESQGGTSQAYPVWIEKLWKNKE
mgnify:CR=1 FL=1